MTASSAPRLTRGLGGEARLVYLVAVALALFAIANPWVIAGVATLQIALWSGDRLGWRPLLRLARRLAVLFAVVAVAYGLFPLEDQGADRWWSLAVGAWSIDINLAGLHHAVVMSLRVLALVVASAWVRLSGGPGSFIGALRRFGMPHFLAVAMDATLALAAEGGGGGGHGRGEGRRRRGFTLSLAELRRGRLGAINDLIERSLDRAERAVGERPGLTSDQARDVAVIVGIATAILALKLVQVLPGLPFAPGHKNVLVVPLLLLAAGLTRARFGGLWTGLTVGTVSVLLGLGKYGILEIAHVAAPGLAADLLLRFAPAKGAVWLRLIRYGAVGALIGLTRFAANFLVIVLAGAPTVAFVLYLPMLASQMAFGAFSALASLSILDMAARRGSDAGSELAMPGEESAKGNGRSG